MSIATANTGLGWYLDHIKGTPLLTAEQERQLARRVREHSDPIAREQMVQANLRLVVKIAKDYSNAGMTLNDLVAEGNLGLMRAVEEFDPDAGVRFSTYASWWIKQAIRRAMINAGQPIHIPAYLAKLIAKWRRTHSRLKARLDRAPTLEEMARVMKLSQKKAEIVQQGLRATNAHGQIGDTESQALAEMVPDGRIESPDQNLLDASNAPLVRSLLANLEPRERKILELRYGLDASGRQTDDEDEDTEQPTYKEIGKAVGLTRERVRQLEKQSLAKLKALTDEAL